MPLRRTAAILLAVLLALIADPAARPVHAAITTTWSKNFGTASQTTVITETTMDSSGNIYVAGYFDGASVSLGSVTLTRIGTTDTFAAKLDSSGTVVWAKNFGGAGAYAYPRSVAVDSSGNVFLAGQFNTAGLTTPSLTLTGSSDSYVIKLDSSGTATWARAYGVASGRTDARRVAVDGAGNSHVLGTLDTTLTTPSLTRIGGQDVFVLKLDSSGSTTWARNYGGAGTRTSAGGLAVDGSGNVHVTGSFDASLTTPSLAKIGTSDALVLKIDSSGSTTWSRGIGGAGASASGNGIAVDSSGNAYVTGGFSSADLTTPSLTRVGTQDAFMIKYDSGGTIASSQSFSGAGASAAGNRIALDGSGNIYVAGNFNSANLTTPALTRIAWDLFVVKMSSSGTILDSQNYGGSGSSTGRSGEMGLAVDSGGSIVLVGIMDVDFTTPALTRIGSSDGFVLKAGGSATVTLSVTVSGSGSVASSPSGISCGSTCSASFSSGASVTLTTTASSGNTFSGWSGDCSGSSATATVTMSAARSCTATFAASTGTTTTPPSWLGPSGNGQLTFTNVEATIDSSGRLSASIPSGNFNAANLTFTATLADGSSLPSWLTFNSATLTFSGTMPSAAAAPAIAADAQSSSGRWLATPPLKIAASLSIRLQVRDASGQTATVTFPFIAYGTRVPAAVVAVSVADTGVSGNAASVAPALSNDGAAVVFQSTAGNLVQDFSSVSGVIRYDVASGRLARFSTGTFMGTISGAANGWSGAAAISADARAIAFSSDAADIGQPWGNGLRQVWVADASLARVAYTTASPTAASAAADGTLGNGASDSPALSEDGRYVAFESEATNLVAGATDGTRRVYRKDRTTGAVELAGTGRRAAISADGRYVAFDDGATLFRRDMSTGGTATVGPGTTARISRDGRYVAAQRSGAILRFDVSAGTAATVTADGSAPSISGDGRFVAFVGGDQVYVHDAVAGATVLVSTNAGNSAGNGASSGPAISGDGRFVAFASQATDLVVGQSTGQLYLAGNPLSPPITSGWWWDPSQPGSGFAIETAGDRLMLGAFLYAADGTSTWYMAQGTFSTTGWSAPIHLYADGQTLAGEYRAATLVATAGTGTLSISSRIAALLSGAHTAGLQRYDFVSGGSTAGAQLGAPESGWWWNPDEPGTGWHLEIQNQTLFVAGFVYDSRGQASWVSSAGVMSSTRAYSGTLTRCSDGQILGGAFRAATCAGSSETIALAFTSPIAATMVLPSGRQVSLKRFRF